MDTGAERIEDIIASVLSTHGVIPSPAGWTIEPASGGLNSRVFFMRQIDQPPAMTVRLSTKSKAGMIRREAEILTSLEGTCGCAPTGVGLIEDCRLGGRVLLAHSFVAGSTAPLSTVSKRRLRALGACLATVHAPKRDVYTVWPELDPTRGNRAMAYRDRLSAMTRYATFNRHMSDDLHRRIERLYANLSALHFPPDKGWDETTFSQLHGDTSIGNILWNGDNVTLIDWEYARHGDPAEELAYVLAEQPLSKAAMSVLWEGYVKNGGDRTSMERVAYYAPLVALDSVLWWGDFHADQGRAPAKSPEVAAFMERAEALLGATGRS